MQQHPIRNWPSTPRAGLRAPPTFQAQALPGLTASGRCRAAVVRSQLQSVGPAPRPLNSRLWKAAFHIGAAPRLRTGQYLQSRDTPSALDAQQLLQQQTSSAGDPSSPSALFEAARTSVPLFQTIANADDERRRRAQDSVLVEHIPGFASVGSSVYEVSVVFIFRVRCRKPSLTVISADF